MIQHKNVNLNLADNREQKIVFEVMSLITAQR